MSNPIKQTIKKAVEKVSSLIAATMNQGAKNSPQVMINQRMLFNFYQFAVSQGYRFNLDETGFRNYSQFEEDGILLYIFAVIGAEHKTFIDVGSGDGINSNCANFAVNFGWNGLFIDGDPANIERGRKYYTNNPDTTLYPPTFVNAFIQRENINELIRDNGFAGGGG